ncbi:MAG: Ig-like domain-containing protein [Gemmatimonadetes bacterium]|nr:Ig-like domain-containing protein [Gemmatimonadota bacterium]
MDRTQPNHAPSRARFGGLFRRVAVGTIVVMVAASCDGSIAEVFHERPVAKLSIEPALNTMRTGEAKDLTVKATDAAGEVIEHAPIAWSSSDSSVVRIAADGRLTAIAQGSADVVANSGGARAIARVMVLAAVSRVEVPEQELLEAVRTPPAVFVRDAAGAVLLDRKVTLSSSDPAVLAINADGSVAARRPGSVTVTAVSEGVSGSGVVTVRGAPLRRVFFDYLDDAVVEVGGTRPLPAVFETLTGARVEREAVWASSDPGVVAVDTPGRARGVSPGVATVTATTGDRTGSVTVHVLRYPDPLRFTELSVTYRRVCAVAVGGSAYCWGALRVPSMLDSSAPLEGVRPIGPAAPGDVGHRFSTIPLPAAEAVRFTSVKIADRVTCGLAVGGAVHCWGEGLPRTVLPSPGYGYMELAVSARVACGRAADGVVDCWAPTAKGMSGAPVRMPGNVLFRALVGSAATDVNGSPMCGITLSLEAFCWGAAGATPVRVGGDLRFSALAVSARSACGVTAEGKAYCWGDNEHGQLGNGTQVASAAPVEVAGGLRFRRIVAAFRHACGVTEDGRAYCWGRNSEGALGDPASVGSVVATPRAVTGGLKFATIETSWDTACGIATDGLTYCWGRNYDGELGQAQGTHHLTPTPIRTQ